MNINTNQYNEIIFKIDRVSVIKSCTPGQISEYIFNIISKIITKLLHHQHYYKDCECITSI